MAFPFIGREYELTLLRKLFKKEVANLVVVQGRRRIGKSRLIEEFAKNHVFYHFTGMPPSSETTHRSQLKEFSYQLSVQTGLPEVTVDDWSKLFLLLADKIKSGRIIVLFDEITWMGSKDPDFLGKLKNAWDIYYKKNDQLILFLCGSVSTWIEKNIISSTGFLGRISLTLTVDELPLRDCNMFWLKRGSYVSAYEKLKILSVTGGIPRYLEQISPSESAEENIKDLCFTKSGPLVHEFDAIFSDLFSRRAPLYKEVIKCLLTGPKELTDIFELLGRSPAGSMSRYLDDLVKSGFVSRDYSWHLQSGLVSKLSLFRLSDNYLRFFLNYIEKALPKIDNNEFDSKSLRSLPGWDSIMGLQFENLVLKNRTYIKECLRLTSGDIVSNNPFFQRKTKKTPGCQIDYLIQTTYNTLFICEIKFSKRPLGKRVITEVKNKMERLVSPKGFSKRPVLIHVNGVTDEVIQSGFFAEIIDFSDLLSSPRSR